MKPTNLLFILSDQHRRDVTGCYGNPIVQTPNLDALAARGTRFSNAYTPCPLCVPARAALATGRYVHQIGNWDNAFPYHGDQPSWGHRLKAQGLRVDSIGKLHFRSQEDDNGFTEEFEPLHVVAGIGDVLGAIRDDPPWRNKRQEVLNAGPGDSTYLRYDARNAASAGRWLTEHAQDDKPWVLFLAFVCPHPPYTAPQEFYDLYAGQDLPLPAQWRVDDWPNHPALDYFRRFLSLSDGLDEVAIRNFMTAYYGVCTYLDRQVGRVLQQLDELGLTDTTRVIYTTDHGESLGARGLSGKFTMYEESVALPFIMAGPDVPAGKVVETPISLLDCFPTILEAVGAVPDPEDATLPGRSLWSIAQAPDEDRTVFSEYHAVGSRNASFMVRKRQFKYIYYVTEPPQLFDLTLDPEERHNLATAADQQAVLQEFERELRSLLDPEEVDASAKADQWTKVEAFGGREKVIQRGTFDNSPIPGEKPAFRTYS